MKKPLEHEYQHKDLAESAKHTLINAMKGTGDLFTTAVDTVGRSVSSVLENTEKATSTFLSALSDIIWATLHAATEVGGDISQAAKGIVLGVLRSTKETGAEAITTIGDVASAIVRGTQEVAGDVGKAALGAVEGAIYAAKELGLEVEQAAAAAANGAMKAASDIGSTAAETVRKAITGTIAGVKVVLKEPFKKSDEPPKK